MKSAVTRKGTQSEEIEERRQKKKKKKRRRSRTIKTDAADRMKSAVTRKRNPEKN
jgi:hypothetical protein